MSQETIYDCIIIGSGPAGLSASVYAKRAGLNALTIEREPMSGGQVLLTYEVDNYLGIPGINGFDLGVKFREHADKLKCEFFEGTVTGFNKEGDVFNVTTSSGTFHAKTLLAAMGARHAKLNVPGEDLPGVSYCATCDGALYRKKVCAVVGGGDVAVEDAIFLSRMCEKVYLIHRRDELRAVQVLQDEVKSLGNVEILWDTIVEKVNGEKHVESLAIKNVKTGKQDTLQVNGLFVAVGIIPSTELFKDKVACDERGYIIAGEEGITKTDGIFAAGDLRTKKLRQISTAVGDGANAITSVQEYLIKLKNKQ